MKHQTNFTTAELLLIRKMSRMWLFGDYAYEDDDTALSIIDKIDKIITRDLPESIKIKEKK